MNEAEKYQKRLQAIAEKRRVHEEEEKVRQEIKEEGLKLSQNKRKSVREQWLMEMTPSSAEDPKVQSGIPNLKSTEKTAEETQRSERPELEKTEKSNEESSQTGEHEPSIHLADNIEKPVRAYLGEEERDVLGILEGEVERNLPLKIAQEDIEEKRKVKTEEQEVYQLAGDLPHLSMQHYNTLDEAYGSLDDRKTVLKMAEDNVEVEEEEWEMVNCPEEGLDLVLTSDLTQAQTDSNLCPKGDGVILMVAQIFIIDEEEDLELVESEELRLAVGEKSNLEDAGEYQLERHGEERPPEDALQTLCLEKEACPDTSAPLHELSNVTDIISEEPSVECKHNLSHILTHTTCTLDESADNTECKGNNVISASRILEVNEAPDPEDDESQYNFISVDSKKEKSPSMLQRESTAQCTEQESEILTLMPPNVTPNRTEMVTSTTTKTCHCCAVM